MLCPECFGDTKSENKGIIRHRVCRSCGHKFSTIEVLYEPEMHTREKLEKFMRERKRESTTAMLAAYFMVASSTINTLMTRLENEGKVSKTKGKNGKNLWRWIDQVAVPNKPVAKQQPQSNQIIGKAFKATTSYPHVRGYED